MKRCEVSNFTLLALLIGGLLLLAGVISCAPTGIYHTVQPGQTLYRIAQTYQISETTLARTNRITDPTKLKVGQKLYVPGVTRPRQVPASSTAKSAPVKPEKAPALTPPGTTRDAKSPTVVPAPATTVKAAAPAQRPPKTPAKGNFIWPLEGKVVSQFGANSGSTNKGIEISAAEGRPILAAASGKVIYSGNGIRGYGNLIIIEHADDFFTVYGYNKQNLVSANAFVGQGDKIALSGQPPTGQSPRLHFEIRQGKVAVNPIFHLP